MFANCVWESSSTSWESQTLPLSIIGKKSALFVHTFGALYLETSRKWKSRIRKWKPRIAWRRTCHFTLCLPVWLSVIVYLLKIEVHPSWNRTVENKWFDLRSYYYPVLTQCSDWTLFFDFSQPHTLCIWQCLVSTQRVVIYINIYIFPINLLHTPYMYSQHQLN